MVPVRKPGRPLSTCPHVPGQPCPCSGVTAAIPRKQKCGCSTNSAASSTTAIESDAAIPGAPPSPSKAPFRVQKQGSKAGTARKPSFDLSNLERMDAAQINILQYGPADSKPLVMNGMNGHTYPHLARPVMVPNMGYVPVLQSGFEPQLHNNYSAPTHFPMPPGQMEQVDLSPFIPKSEIGQPTPTQAPASLPMQAPAPTATSNGSSSCCGGSSDMSLPSSTPALTENTSGGSSCCSVSPSVSLQSSALSHSVTPKSNGNPNSGSCCSSSRQSLEFEPNGTHTGQPSTGAILSQYHPPVGINHPIYSNTLPQASLFTMPAPYGSMAFPLQPSQWQTISAANGTSLPQDPLSLAQTISFNRIGSSDKEPDHQCTCGDGCECIGCVAHPYNQATQDYVRSAWSMQDPSLAGSFSESGYMDEDGMPRTVLVMTDQQHGQQAPESPTQTLSDSASATSEDQQGLSANDFFFVNYPFTGDGSCGGDTDSCPCGDDCQCLGCSIHNANPAPVPD